jgi:membrane-anchored protein YejM (alkaline phosphatase superfamily)
MPYSFSMTSRRISFICARLCFGLFTLLTSFYCLLVYIPFTRQSVIEWSLIKWLPVFVKFHTLLYWAALSLLSATLLPGLRRAETKRITVAFLSTHALLGVFLLFRPLLSDLPTDERSFIWSLIALFPLLWLAAIDCISHHREFKAAERTESRFTYTMVALSAVFLSLLYVGVFYLRYVKRGIVSFRWTEMLVAVVWSIASHLLVFTLIFVILKLIRIISGRFAAPSKISFYLYNLLASIISMLIFRKVIFSAISFNNHYADVFSITVSLALTAFVFGLGLRLRGFGAGSPYEEVESISARWAFNQKSLWAARALLLVGVMIAAYAVPASVASTDWNSLGQMMSVILVWLLTCALFWRIKLARQVKQYSLLALLLIAVVSFGAYKVLSASESRWPGILQDKELEVGVLLERYANYDISFGLARKLLSPAQVESGEAQPDKREFFDLLRHNTNLTSSAEVGPVAVNLVNELKPTSNKKPNIFIFVVDSLRQDHVSPYNNAVSFTPSIQAFARESVVMKNAFTHYGGTALSEPSIWVGGMQLHKQFVEPFYPLNALQKMLEIDEYDSFITLDPILEKIVKPSPEIVKLDEGTDWKRYDFCNTLQEIQQKIDSRSDQQRPIFVYSQPQNIHLVALKSSSYTASPNEAYPGFETEHASQIKRMDNSFGKFIQYLKARGLYDNSIVVLTADHGDSLGEEGRWGHGNLLYPEIIRIPLIIHLPTELRQNVVWDDEQITFSTDITPSLYYLLGHAPIIPSPVYGRPLFTTTTAEQKQYRQDSYLLVSSYGPVYGILSDNGRSLFIADALNDKEYFYNLADDPKGTRNRSDAAISAKHEEIIRQHLEAINKFYKFTPPQN